MSKTKLPDVEKPEFKRVNLPLKPRYKDIFQLYEDIKKYQILKKSNFQILKV